MVVAWWRTTLLPVRHMYNDLRRQACCKSHGVASMQAGCPVTLHAAVHSSWPHATCCSQQQQQQHSWLVPAFRLVLDGRLAVFLALLLGGWRAVVIAGRHSASAWLAGCACTPACLCVAAGYRMPVAGAGWLSFEGGVASLLVRPVTGSSDTLAHMHVSTWLHYSPAAGVLWWKRGGTAQRLGCPLPPSVALWCRASWQCCPCKACGTAARLSPAF
ncbi:hypothetical protein COO60DRAFT_1103119 [Scenedesmus sp. NREL 46B-D3]|nr:hypothetical protein COO60DRAFT_1103119 [Scenedesmus sp. NREL 46B-D3]